MDKRLIKSISEKGMISFINRAFYANVLLAIVLLCYCLSANCQKSSQIFKATGTPARPKVSISWDRYYDSEGLTMLFKNIAKKHPGLAKMEAIGKSYLGKKLWCLTITDYKVGKPDQKPGMYIQANIHGNEIQGSEFSLYTAWYLTESFEDSKFIRNLLSRKVIYIVPTVNPDGRDFFIHQSSTNTSGRYTLKPFDRDGDGRFNEDNLDDLDQDGNIAMMRYKDPFGAYRINPDDNRLMIEISRDSVTWITGRARAKFPSPENYDYIREGGIDNDKDGKIDEDGFASDSIFDPRTWSHLNDFDPNRDFNKFSLVETQAIKTFFESHPNISIAQSFHNCAGLFFNGVTEDSQVMKNDKLIYRAIGLHGQEIIPGYKYVKNEIGPLRGREIDWMFSKRGVYALIVELWTNYLFYDHQYQQISDQENCMYRADNELLFGDAFIPWHHFQHPVLGDVEIGGMKKNFDRLHPGFLIESDAHRNMAFSLYCANQTPELEIKNIENNELTHGNKKIIVHLSNNGLLPTHSEPDLKYKITRPDLLFLKTKDEVLEAQSIVVDSSGKQIVLNTTKLNPQRLEINNIPGKSEITIEWVVKSEKNEPFEIVVDSVKGGMISKKLTMIKNESITMHSQ